MRPRRSIRPPTPSPSALQVLIETAAPVLAAHGEQRSLAAPWLAAASVSMSIASGGGWRLSATPQEFLEPMLAH